MSYIYTHNVYNIFIVNILFGGSLCNYRHPGPRRVWEGGLTWSCCRRFHSRRRCRRRLPSRRHRCRHPRFHRPRRAPRHRQDRRPCTTAAAPSGTSHNPPALAPAYTAASLPQTCARTAAVGTRVTGTAKSAVSSAKSPAAARQRLAAGCRTVACGGRAASLAHQAGGGGIWRCHGYV